MMSRGVALVLVLAVSLLAAPLAADAQEPGRIYRIGWLWLLPASTGVECEEAFVKGLHHLGWIEGQNIRMIFRRGDGKRELLPGFAKELVDLRVDLIVGAVTDTARAAKQATSTIPILTVTPADPIGNGLVQSLARPGLDRLQLKVQRLRRSFEQSHLWRVRRVLRMHQNRDSRGFGQRFLEKLQLLSG